MCVCVCSENASAVPGGSIIVTIIIRLGVSIIRKFVDAVWWYCDFIVYT